MNFLTPLIDNFVRKKISDQNLWNGILRKILAASE
jgi:hypothetical protein